MTTVTAILAIATALLTILDSARRYMGGFFSDRYVMKRVADRIDFEDDHLAAAQRVEAAGYPDFANELREAGRKAIPRLVETYRDRRSHKSTFLFGYIAGLLFAVALIGGVLTNLAVDRFEQPTLHMWLANAIAVGFLLSILAYGGAFICWFRSLNRVQARVELLTR
ncbi:hypothetical protein [Rhodococcus sp. RCBS9]|uniref:hypothetical protein n=1 Tax=Rhodococcus sp. RCBS9 TaxID=3031999 RepID=UPI000641D7F9|nr:hypothetical protein [Rhodococcus sp. RCBS9]KLN67479.1 hypothetical protein ABM90_32605 [Rhodococcus erythropolis]WEX06192.1 hypothetical protein P0M12_12390 [Rhodococcus sp. RCBS9]